MALRRAHAAALLLLSLHEFSVFAASLQTNFLNLSNTSSSFDAFSLRNLNKSSETDEYDDCFNSATPRRGLYPAIQQDCLNAAKELYYIRDPFRTITFARKRNVGFKLPQVVRNGTCVISVDVMNDDDSDHFKPWLVYAAARDIAYRCTQGAFRLGGRTLTGPRKVVDVLVFGRIWPPKTGLVELTALESGVVIARERSASVDSSLLNETSLNLTKSPMANTTSLDASLGLNDPEFGGALKCYDPPLPRERVWPIKFEDCEVATEAILADRDRDQKYTFSRETVATEFYYSLPAKFPYRSCVVLLDMNNNHDQDTVRLSIVEATAWVLAHKCSGEEKSVEQYGGRGTVGVGAKDLINVWVYGLPPPVGATNVTNPVLAQPAPFTDND